MNNANKARSIRMSDETWEKLYKFKEKGKSWDYMFNELFEIMEDLNN